MSFGIHSPRFSLFLAPAAESCHQWSLSFLDWLFKERNLCALIVTFGIEAPLIVPLLLCLELVVDSNGPVSVLGHYIFGCFECLWVDFFGHSVANIIFLDFLD